MTETVSRRSAIRAAGCVLAGGAFRSRIQAGSAPLATDGLFHASGRPRVPQPVFAYDAMVPIHVNYRRLWHSKSNDWPADYSVSTPVFEAPMGKYD